MKQYDFTGKLILEGEFIDYVINGFGKEFVDNGKLIFEGEYLEGEKWNGKIYGSDNIY